MSAKRVLMLVGDFVEDYEAMVPFQMLVMAGHRVDAVCPGRRAGQKVRTAVHDFEGDQTYTEKPGHNFALTASFSRVKPQSYDALVIPGGRSPEYIRLDKRVLAMVRHFASRGKPIASICHGQQVLVAAGVVQGKKCTAYPALRPDLERAGAKWQKVNATFSNTCRDGNLVTAPAWPAHPGWMREFLGLLGTRIVT